MTICLLTLVRFSLEVCKVQKEKFYFLKHNTPLLITYTRSITIMKMFRFFNIIGLVA